MPSHQMEFYCAAIVGNMPVVDRCINNGRIDVASQTFAGHTILHGACNINKPGVVQDLLKNPEIRERLLNVKDERRGRTPLQVSIALGNNALVLTLLQAGADPGIKDNDGRSALHLACFYNSPNRVCVELLSREIPIEVNTKDHFGKSCLTYAAENGNAALVFLLLEKESTRKRIPIWHWDLSSVPEEDCSRPPYGTIIRLLLDAGADIVPKLNENRSHPVHQQFFQFWRKLVLDRHQRLRSAAAQGNCVALQQILGTGEISDVDRPSPVSGWTPLMIACRYGNVATVELLMEAGASPWINTLLEERTALQIAQEYGHLEVVQNILRHVLC